MIGLPSAAPFPNFTGGASAAKNGDQHFNQHSEFGGLNVSKGVHPALAVVMVLAAVGVTLYVKR